MKQLLIQAAKLSWLYAEIRESIASRNFGLQFSRKLYSAYKLNNILFISRIIVMISCGNEIETKFNLHFGQEWGRIRREHNQQDDYTKNAWNPIHQQALSRHCQKRTFEQSFPVKSDCENRTVAQTRF